MVGKRLSLSVKKTTANITESIMNPRVTYSDKYTWEELLSIEKRRRAILKRQGQPFFRILWYWDGTLLKILSRDRLMMLTMAIFILIRIGAHLELLPEVLNDIAGADIGVIGAFLSFFLVLFVNDSSSSFERLYETSMRCKNQILDLAALARATLPRSHALRLVRFLNAAHVAGYVGLSRTYTYRNFFTELNRLNRLLTPAEMRRIESIDMDKGGKCFRELCAWCLLEVSTAERDDLVSPRIAVQYRDHILQLQTGFEELFDDDDQPISFAYYHFVCFLSAVYLPLFAMSSALDAGVGESAYWVTDVVSGCVVCLQAIFVVGLRTLAESMSDPYGPDVDNLSVLHYVTHTWEMSHRILGAQAQGPIDELAEERMSREGILEDTQRREEVDIDLSKEVPEELAKQLSSEAIYASWSRMEDPLDQGTGQNGATLIEARTFSGDEISISKP